MIRTETLEFDSDGANYSLNITEQVRAIVARSGLREGNVLVYFQHTTGAVMIIEHEAGFLVDLEDTLERLVPAGADYKHHMRQYDLNGRSHVLAGILNSSVSVPVSGSRMLLGTYQDIMVIDLQPEAKPRRVIVQVMGE